MNYEDMSDFDIEVEVTKILFPFVLGDGYEFIGSRDGFIYTKEDRKEHKLSGSRLICTIKNYCNSPSDAWPVIVENRISVTPYLNVNCLWSAIKKTEAETVHVTMQNPLRAAMICFLKMKDAENEK